MRITEVTGQKTRTPDQQRIDALKQQKDRVSTQLKTERERQKRQKAMQTIQKNSQVLTKLNTR